MLKSSKYYYSDALFQLEINLHKVRQELIIMLEFHEQTDCETCLQLKCSCSKSDPQPTDTTSGTVDKGSANNTPGASQRSANNNTASEVKTGRGQSDPSPAPPTPDKLTVDKDIEAWMKASKKHAVTTEKVVLTPKKSLVTIESVRPADVPLKTLQKSNVITTPMLNSNYMNNLSHLNSTSVVNNPTMEAFFKYFKHQMNGTQVVYMSSQLATACQNDTKQNYTYF